MASKADIINFALSHIGARRIADSDINDPNSPTPGSRQGNLWVDQARDECLSSYPWTFASLRKRLIPKTFTTVEAPSYTNDWTNAYFYPCGCIQMQYIVDPNRSSTVELITNTPYAVEANPSTAANEERRLVLCNVANASAVYTTSDVEYESLPPHFVEPMAILLASKIAFPITNDLELKAALLRLYNVSLQAYTAQDANQIHNKGPQDSRVIRSRSS